MPNPRDSGSSFLGPWKITDKAALVGVVGAALALIVLVTIPIGLVAVGVLFALGQIWVPPSADEKSYLPDTKGFKVAQFFQALKLKTKESFTPLVALGVGPPSADPYHDLDENIIAPPFRLAAWWSLIGAFALGAIDMFLNPFLYPFWGGPYLSVGFIYWILSIPGWYAVIQIVAHIFRWRAEGVGVIGSEIAPATMLNKVWQDVSPKEVLSRAGIWSAVPLVVALVAWVMFKFSILIVVAVVLVLSSVIFFAIASRMMTKAYRSSWFEKEIAPGTNWTQVWSVVRPNAMPQFAGGVALPSEDEWYQATPDEPYDPPLNLASFTFAEGDYYGSLTKGTDISPITNQVISVFGSDDKPVTTVVLAPMGEVDPASGREMIGTVSKIGFRLYYSSRQPDVRDIFDPSSDPRWREFAVRATLMREMEKEISGGTDFVFIKASMITKKSDQNIAEVVLKPPNNISFEQVNQRIDSMLGSLENVPWLRVSKADAKKNSSTSNISIFIGDKPTEDTKYSYRSSGSKSRVLSADMAYIMYKNGIYSKSGTPPILIDIEKVTDKVTESLFKMPLGEDISKMLKKDLWKSIGASSGNDYLEIRTSGEGVEAGTFIMTSAPKNPLAAVFPFSNYQDQLMPGRNWKQDQINDPKVKQKPKPWDARLGWGVGVFSNNEIGWDDFEKGTEPHLLIAGSSGSGKSVCLQSMIVQLAYNNTPDDLVFWLIEPKIGMQRFKKLDVTQRFVDSWYPYEDFFESVDEIVGDALQEMLRRNKLLAQYEMPDGGIPDRLVQGREIAHNEGDKMDEYGNTENHPLKIPYLVLIIEECGTLFADAPSKEDAEKQKRILAIAARIAREGRSAGVYIVCTTQYPTNASIPSVIRNQMRRVGLACRSRFASEVVIDESGLEDPSMRANKGSGMIIDGLTYRPLRMFWLQDGDTTKGETNDIVDNLGTLPKNSIFNAPAKVSTAKAGNAPASGKKKPGKPSPMIDSMTFDVPAPAASVIAQWESATVQSGFESNIGAKFDDAIARDKATKDIASEDYDDLVSGI